MTVLGRAEPRNNRHRTLGAEYVLFDDLIKIAEADSDNRDDAVVIQVPEASSVVSIRERDDFRPSYLDIYYEAEISDEKVAVEIHAVYLDSPFVPKYSRLIGHIWREESLLAIYARTV